MEEGVGREGEGGAGRTAQARQGRRGRGRVEERGGRTRARPRQAALRRRGKACAGDGSGAGRRCVRGCACVRTCVFVGGGMRVCVGIPSLQYARGGARGSLWQPARASHSECSTGPGAEHARALAAGGLLPQHHQAQGARAQEVRQWRMTCGLHAPHAPSTHVTLSRVHATHWLRIARISVT